MATRPKILYISSAYEDYLAVTLLDGLRALGTVDVVDYPRNAFVYNTAPDATRAKTYGRGFTAYFRQPEPEINRDHVWKRAEEGEFDLVVFADINNCFGLFIENGVPLLGKVPMAVIDGADSPAIYPKGPRFWRPRPWRMLPRIGKVDFRFKREIGPWTHRTEVYGLLPATIAKHVGPSRKLIPLAFSIPADNIVDAVPEKTQRFPAHIVDEEVSARIGAQTGYAFDTEADYYADLRASRFGITTKRAGWDCMRHYELAASGTIPCFRELSKKPSTCAPHGLVDGVNCIEYADADELFAKLERLSPEDEQKLAEGALAWAKANNTVARAEQFLATCGVAAEDRD